MNLINQNYGTCSVCKDSNLITNSKQNQLSAAYIEKYKAFIPKAPYLYFPKFHRERIFYDVAKLAGYKKTSQPHKKKSDNVYEYKQYITDNKELNSKILHYLKTGVSYTQSSAAGSGKTFGYLKFYIPEIQKTENIKYVFVTPYLDPKDQLKKKIIKGHFGDFAKDNFAVYDEDIKSVPSDGQDYTALICTTNRLKEACKRLASQPDTEKITIIIDESHLLTDEYGFRYDVIDTYFQIMQLEKQNKLFSVVHISATPDIFFDSAILKHEIINTQREKNTNIIYQFVNREKNDLNLVVLQLIANILGSKKKVLIRINSKPRIDSISEMLVKFGIVKRNEIAKFTANRTDEVSPEQRKLAENECFDDNIKVVFCTKILDCAINVNNLDFEIIYAAILPADYNERPLIQLPSRFRKMMDILQPIKVHIIHPEGRDNEEDFLNDELKIKKFAEFMHHAKKDAKIITKLTKQKGYSNLTDKENKFLRSANDEKRLSFLKDESFRGVKPKCNITYNKELCCFIASYIAANFSLYNFENNQTSIDYLKKRLEANVLNSSFIRTTLFINPELERKYKSEKPLLKFEHKKKDAQNIEIVLHGIKHNKKDVIDYVYSKTKTREIKSLLSSKHHAEKTEQKGVDVFGEKCKDITVLNKIVKHAEMYFFVEAQHNENDYAVKFLKYQIDKINGTAKKRILEDSKHIYIAFRMLNYCLLNEYSNKIIEKVDNNYFDTLFSTNEYSRYNLLFARYLIDTTNNYIKHIKSDRVEVSNRLKAPFLHVSNFNISEAKLKIIKGSNMFKIKGLFAKMDNTKFKNGFNFSVVTKFNPVFLRQFLALFTNAKITDKKKGEYKAKPIKYNYDGFFKDIGISKKNYVDNFYNDVKENYEIIINNVAHHVETNKTA